MTLPTELEQELLEYINRARADPAGEFDALIADAGRRLGVTKDITDGLTYFGVALDSLRAQLAALPSAPPLAWNPALADAAATHNRLMIRHDEQSHMLPGEKSHIDRVVAAGYTGVHAVAENVFAFAQSAIQAHAAFYIDWGHDREDFDAAGRLRPDWQRRGDGIQDPPGHRINTLSDAYTEVGVSIVADRNPATSVGPLLVTQEFAHRWNYQPQLLGVVYSDDNGNRFYDPGEGIAGVTVTAMGAAGQFTTTSWDSGGYQLELPPGDYTVTHVAPDLPGMAAQRVTIGDVNVKLDVIAGDISADGPPSDIPSTDGNDWLMAGTRGAIINGGAGVDMVSFVEAEARVIIDLGAGIATSGDETWLLFNINNITGSIHDDLIIGDEGNNRLRGLGSYDWFVGSGGNDTYEGGDGRDTVSYANAPRTADGWGVEANLVQGRGLRGQAEGDIYDSIESLTGSSHNDWLAGNDENNVLRGLGGDDIIFGYGGRDTIDGGPGNDYIHGGDGNDRITGGPGHDTIDGGWGWDVAVYSGRKADYYVTIQDDGWTSVYDRRGAGGDGYDLLINVEVLEFTDGKIYLA